MRNEQHKCVSVEAKTVTVQQKKDTYKEREEEKRNLENVLFCFKYYVVLYGSGSGVGGSGEG